MAIYLATFLLLSNVLLGGQEPQNTNTVSEVKWSEQTARSFIRRTPNPDSISMIWDKNHFSWQAGYLMFAMEKIWDSTGDSTFFNYIKRYVDQQVDDQGNVPNFEADALDHFAPGRPMTLHPLMWPSAMLTMAGCTQSEVHFEINMPPAYIEEGKMEFVFSLQAAEESPIR